MHLNDDIKAAAEALKAGELVVFPTETVYGLGGLVWNKQAINNIFKHKGRPAKNPLIIHVETFDDIFKVASIPQDTDCQRWLYLLKTFWPGPLSVILPKNENVSHIVSAGLDTVAVRIPKHPVAQALLRATSEPIAAPSANFSNYISPTQTKHLRPKFTATIKHVLDGGPCVHGIESTVLSLVDEMPTIMRPGAVTKESLEVVLETDIAVVDNEPKDQSPVAPGMLEKHYAPYTPLFITTDKKPEKQYQRTGLICFHPDIADQYPNITEKRILSQNGQLAEVCSKLYDAMSDIDSLELDALFLDTRVGIEKDCPNSGLGAALLDRIRRASSS